MSNKWTDRETRTLDFLVSQGESNEKISKLIKGKTSKEIKEKIKELEI
ncbi:MAG: hypothetical protein ACOCQ5_02995 [Halanaerobiales bacterium]